MTDDRVNRQTANAAELAGITTVLPAKKNAMLMVFLSVWIFLWAGGLLAVLQPLCTGRITGIGFFGSFLLLAWLAGWLFGGGLAIYGFLWMLCGTETIAATPGQLVITRTIGGYSRSRSYASDKIKGLRVDTQEESWTDFLLSLRPFGIGGGKLTFDYGVKVLYFASAIDAVQAEELLGKIRAGLAGVQG